MTAPAPAPTPPALGTPEYDAAMAAKVDAANAAAAASAGPDPALTPKAPVKPEFLEDKFWDAEKGQIRTEDLAKSYKELQAKLSQPKDPPKADDPQATPPADPNADPQKFSLDTFSKEFAEKGALSEDSYKALEANGFTKDIVDTYIAGQVALAQAVEAETYAVVGGKDQYVKMADWATKNLSSAEQQAFDSALDGAAEVRKLAVQGLFARYQAAYGKDPSMVRGGTPSDSVGYQSQAQMVSDMKDPRYQTDPAFRQMVANRLAVSTF